MNRRPNSLIPAPPRLPTLASSEQTVTNVLQVDPPTEVVKREAPAPKRLAPAPPRSRRVVPSHVAEEEVAPTAALAAASPPAPRGSAPTVARSEALVPPRDSAPSLRGLVSSAEAESGGEAPLVPRRALTQPFPAFVNTPEPTSPAAPARQADGPGLLGSMLSDGFGSTVQDVLRASATAAPRVTPPPMAAATPSEVSPARPPRLSIVDRSSVPERASAAPARARTIVAAGVVVAAIVGAFVAGRGTRPRSGGEARALHGFAAVSSLTRAMLSDAGRRPCLMQAAPSRWAAKATRAVPIELVPTSPGELAVGFARDEGEPRGLVFDLAIGQVLRMHEPEAKVDGLARVAPLVASGEVTFATLAAEQDGLRQAVYVRAERPIAVGVVGEELAIVSEPGAAPKPLWKLPGALERLQAVPIGPGAAEGFGVAYLATDRVWFGIAKTDGSIVREPVALESASKVGKPMLASDGRTVSVVYAEGVPGEVPVRVRWARVPVAAAADTETQADVPSPFVELPPGGPGGDAIAPDVAALPDGRWLLLWTEGTEGDRALRAQTFDARGNRLGAALRVSPETGNFGQGTVAVVGDRAAVSFLLKSDSYQLWGTVLQCR
jgi:hypothetical protein